MHMLKFITLNNLKVKLKMAEENNQVVRELKQLDAEEPDPSSLNVRELRGRSVNEELHTPSIRQPTLGLIHMHSHHHHWFHLLSAG